MALRRLLKPISSTTTTAVPTSPAPAPISPTKTPLTSRLGITLPASPAPAPAPAPAPSPTYRASPTTAPRQSRVAETSGIVSSAARTTLDEQNKLKEARQAKNSAAEAGPEPQENSFSPASYETSMDSQGGSSATPFTEEEDALFQDLLNSHEGSWADKQKALQYNAAKMQRQNAEVNARLGGSIGGGFAGGMAQAQLGANQQMLEERNKHDDRGRDLRLSYLDKKINQRNRLDDRQFQREKFLEDMSFREHLQNNEMGYNNARMKSDQAFQSGMQDDRQAHDTAMATAANQASNPVQDPEKKAREEQVANAVNKMGISSDKATEAYDLYYQERGRYPKNWNEMKDALGKIGYQT